MRRLAARLILALALLAPLAAQAVEPDEMLKDAALEQRARRLSADLRCMVCQNQSIDDSDAPLARDLRILVRERLTAGDSDEQVRAYLVARYGDFILLKPPLRATTVLLWAAPFAVLALGAMFIVLRRRRPDPASPLTEEERAAIAALAGGEDRITKV